MTAHPIDTEALRATAEATIEEYGPLAWPDIPSADLLALLEALAAAEHRATRAEAQSATRRISTEYWKERAEDEAQAALDERVAAEAADGRADHAEARIKAVEGVLDDLEQQPPDQIGWDAAGLLPVFRRALDGDA